MWTKFKNYLENLYEELRSRMSMVRLYKLFTDKVDGRPVYLWRDNKNVYWLASDRYGLRVKRRQGD